MCFDIITGIINDPAAFALRAARIAALSGEDVLGTDGSPSVMSIIRFLAFAFVEADNVFWHLTIAAA